MTTTINTSRAPVTFGGPVSHFAATVVAAPVGVGVCGGGCGATARRITSSI
jgi:hypothetical protein